MAGADWRRCRAGFGPGRGPRSRPGLQQPDQRRPVQHFSARRGDHGRDPRDSRLDQLSRRGTFAARRILRARAVCDGGHGHSGGRKRTGHRVRGAGDELHLHLYSGGLPAPLHQIERSLAEIFPARLFCHGLLSLRHRDGLRRHGHHQDRRHSVLHYGAVLHAFARHAGPRPDFRGAGIQGGRRAVPNLCAGRLRRRAHARDRPAGFRAQGRDVRRDAADLHGGLRRLSEPLVLGDLRSPPCSRCSSAISPRSCRPT